MMWPRCEHWRAFVEQRRFARYLCWDSSPQYGKDYQVCTIASIPRDCLLAVLRAFSELASLNVDGVDLGVRRRPRDCASHLRAHVHDPGCNCSARASCSSDWVRVRSVRAQARDPGPQPTP
eukprot:11689772-Alexandrium_andersonii.AAC.1